MQGFSLVHSGHVFTSLTLHAQLLYTTFPVHIQEQNSSETHLIPFLYPILHAGSSNLGLCRSILENGVKKSFP